MAMVPTSKLTREGITDAAEDMLISSEQYFYGSLRGISDGKDLVDFVDDNRQIFADILRFLKHEERTGK